MIKYFCYYVFTEETQNLIHQNAGLHGSEMQKLKHVKIKQTKLKMTVLPCSKLLTKKIKGENN